MTDESVKCVVCAEFGMFHCAETVGTCTMCGARNVDVNALYTYTDAGERDEVIEAACLENCLLNGRHMMTAHDPDTNPALIEGSIIPANVRLHLSQHMAWAVSKALGVAMLTVPAGPEGINPEDDDPIADLAREMYREHRKDAIRDVANLMADHLDLTPGFDRERFLKLAQVTS